MEGFERHVLSPTGEFNQVNLEIETLSGILQKLTDENERIFEEIRKKHGDKVFEKDPDEIHAYLDKADANNVRIKDLNTRLEALRARHEELKGKALPH